MRELGGLGVVVLFYIGVAYGVFLEQVGYGLARIGETALLRRLELFAVLLIEIAQGLVIGRGYVVEIGVLDRDHVENPFLAARAVNIAGDGGGDLDVAFKRVE